MVACIDNGNPTLLVLRGVDAENDSKGVFDGFTGIYNQMDGAVGNFSEEYKDKLNVVYANYKGGIVRRRRMGPYETFKPPQPINFVDFVECVNPFAIVALGDNVISGLQSEDLSDECLSKIPIITSVSGYRLLRQNNAFHFWPFVLPLLAYLAAEWIIREYSSFDSICIVTDTEDKQGKVLRNIFSKTLSYLGKKVVTIDEDDESKLEELANTNVLTVVYVSGIGGAHDNALRSLLDAQQKNTKLRIISDQSISDPGKRVPKSEGIQYFTSLLGNRDKDKTGSPFAAEMKFEFFVYQTLNLVWDRYNRFMEIYGDKNNEVKFADYLKKTKTYICKSNKIDAYSGHKESAEILFISDNGQLYAPLYVAHGDNQDPVGHYSVRAPLDVAHMLQVVDEQLKDIPFLHVDGKENEVIIKKLEKIGRLISSVFNAKKYLCWIGDCFKAIGKCKIDLTSQNSTWAVKIVEILQRNAIFTEAIQITLGDSFELPDNDAVRAYFKHGHDGRQLLPLSVCLRQRNGPEGSREVGSEIATSRRNKLPSLTSKAEDISLPLRDIVSQHGKLQTKNNFQLKNVQFGDDDKDFLEIVFSKDINFGVIEDNTGKTIRKDDARRLLQICQHIERSVIDSSVNAYMYIFPEVLSETVEFGPEYRNDNNCLLFVTDKRLSYLDLRVLTNVVTRVAYSLRNAISSYRIKLEATKSAIGAIMSRNGSHNIGSHVLAALSHNVGTMPDDRVLYQYIQHRMDYIATATTELPVWNQPLSFVGNLVKAFLMQRHLLDYITGSEGLKAYQFQNRTVDTTSIGCQPNTIRLHVKRIGDDDSAWNEETNYSVEPSKATNFISYPDTPASPNALMRDLEIAIPGGIVGQHAFFTIIENILRNAAKHEWSKIGKEDKNNARKEDKNNARLKYLDMHIDFKDNPQAGIVEVVAWTDSEYSRTQYKQGDFADKAGSLTPTEIQESLSREKVENEFDLSSIDADHKKLQVRMARSFIGANGDLHKENWGLAEMRISAGYLNTANISEIGGLDENKSSELSLIKPVMVLNGDHYCLGYHFHIPKPRELLIVVPRDLRVDKDVINGANQRLKRYGVAVITESEVQAESSSKERSSKLSYAYVLLKEFLKNDKPDKQSEDMRKWKLPFRVITTGTEPLRPNENAGFDRRADFAREDKDFFEEKVFKSWLAQVAGSDATAKAEAEQLLFDIYRSWTRHLKSEKKVKDIPIAIDLRGGSAESNDGTPYITTGSGGNSEKSLISDIDLLKIVFGNCFNTAVESFFKMRGGVEGETGKVLNAMKVLSPRKVDFKCVEETGRKLSIEEMIRDQLRNWCNNVRGCGLTGRFSQVLTKIDNTPAGDLDDIDIPEGLIEFVDYLATVILGQARVFLSKYEEHYNTLPKEIAARTDSAVSQKIDQLDGQQIIETVSESDKIKVLKARGTYSNDGKSCCMQSSVLAYWRHEDACVTRTLSMSDEANSTRDIPINVEYLEPLSGAQSYINSFSILTQGDALQKVRFVSKLIETGLVKVLVVDERLKKFEEDHSDVKCTFAKIGIAALGEDSKATTNIFSAMESRSVGKVSAIPIDDYATKVGDYDILVIHQGIIDKKLKNHGDPQVIDNFINRLKEDVRYVIVTTGRGSPANIPENVRVLPFSVVESTLFKKYPEKLVLVDAIMNVLPSGRKENV